MSGWRRESKRHSLAARGILTAQSNTFDSKLSASPHVVRGFMQTCEDCGSKFFVVHGPRYGTARRFCTKCMYKKKLAANRAWFKTEEGRECRRQSARRWRKTLKGKEACRLHHSRWAKKHAVEIREKRRVYMQEQRAFLRSQGLTPKDLKLMRLDALIEKEYGVKR